MNPVQKIHTLPLPVLILLQTLLDDMLLQTLFSNMFNLKLVSFMTKACLLIQHQIPR